MEKSQVTEIIKSIGVILIFLLILQNVALIFHTYGVSNPNLGLFRDLFIRISGVVGLMILFGISRWLYIKNLFPTWLKAIIEGLKKPK